MKILLKSATFLFTISLFTSCLNSEKKVAKEIELTEHQPETIIFENKAHEIVYNMVQKTGTIDKLKSLKDVTYKYTYRTPDGKEDISTERYIFDGELSLGTYQKHERTLPQIEGVMEQTFNGTNFSLKQDGKELTNKELLKSVAFTRKTNYFWFAMMQKMLDPGILYEYLREETITNNIYDVIKVSYKTTNNEISDIYHLYINKKTLLVDQFLFTVADRQVTEEPLLMKVTYKKVQGILVPNYRKYTKAKWDGTVLNGALWTEEISENIEFNTQVSNEIFN